MTARKWMQIVLCDTSQNGDHVRSADECHPYVKLEAAIVYGCRACARIPGLRCTKTIKDPKSVGDLMGAIGHIF
jgi:hypothetical protein